MAESIVAKKPAPWLAWLWGFSLFLPYPALPAGSSTGIQLGNVLTLVLLPAALTQWQRLSLAWTAWFVLVAPLVLNLFVTGFSPVDFNFVVLQAVALLALPVTALVFSSRPAPMLAGLVVMFGVHGLAGWWQAVSFAQDQFPWPWLYSNPSFPIDDETQTLMAEYVKRPFGLMPEPSTLVAYTAPWMTMVIAALAEGRRPAPDDGRALVPLTGWRVFAVVALVVTYVLSGSGGLVFFGIGCALLVLIHGRRQAGRHPLLVATAVAVLLGLAIGVQVAVSGRVESESTQLGSWDERATSIRMGLEMIGQADWVELLFGYGGGHVAKIADARQSTTAVHSWMLFYVDTAGLVGAAALIWLTGLMVWCVSRMRDPAVWAVIVLAWLPGPLMMSAYYQVIGAWAFFGVPIVLAARARDPRARGVAPEAGAPLRSS